MRNTRRGSPSLSGSPTHRPTSPSRTGDMRTQSRHRYGAIAAIAFAIMQAGRALAAAAPAIDVTIEPTQIAMGESARLTILTSGSGTLSVTLPVVAGLEFRVIGQSRQIEMINGT